MPDAHTLLPLLGSLTLKKIATRRGSALERICGTRRGTEDEADDLAVMSCHGIEIWLPAAVLGARGATMAPGRVARGARGGASGELLGSLPTDGKNPILTCPIFYFVPPVSVFVGSRIRIYGNERGVFPSVSAESCFHPELTRIYPVFNLCEICLEFDMFIYLLVTNYALAC